MPAGPPDLLRDPNPSHDNVIPFTESVADRQLRVALISHAPPRQCGIATFAGDIVASLGEHVSNIALDVVPICDDADDAPGEGIAILRDDPMSYRAAARAINAAGYDAVWVQHEFGIFGGADGEHLIELTLRIAAPLVVTMHTVLSQPSANQRRIVEHLVARASTIMTMSHHARELLAATYGAGHDRLTVIEHGAPDRDYVAPGEARAARGIESNHVISTFGLLGPGKGIEQVIDALPDIAARFSDVRYRIIGATHPNLRAAEGESYREALKARAAERGVADNIEWIDAFLGNEDLLDELEVCDLYVTPYPGLDQATSGTLSYAVALGKAVISTPFVHARELLADDVGAFFEPGDASALSDAVIALFSRPEELAAMQARAYRRGRQTVWSEFARHAADMLREVAVTPRAGVQSLAEALPVSCGPVIAMSDDTGMLQHARFDVPDRSHGYSIDDNARALMLAARLAAEGADDLAHKAPVYAAFIQDAWNPQTAKFRNFLSFRREWLEAEGSEDAQGRTLCALAETLASSPGGDLAYWARAAYDDALPTARALESPRAMAFAILAASKRLSIEPGHAASRELVQAQCADLARICAAVRRPNWRWFETLLAYDNARLSQALIEGGRRLGRSDLVDSGLDTLEWIAQLQISAKGHFRPIGSDTFDAPGEALPFDQQPLEALAFIESCLAAHEASGAEIWAQRAKLAWNWFFGANDRGIAIVDIDTLRCYDGLTPHGRNHNSGAESILAFTLSHVAMQRAGLTQSERDGGHGRNTAGGALGG
ncbi:glycosyltransferase family 4 protein [Erythrobacter sp.]|jgi:glycosyltransferase involved in cell wall biosynthesis|uniref:glycosyltransferase family 4 protein n=1 Tax=Erythrobacter sp. TaxID=1042 RepID=UPI002EC41142|nr:glycosyltransferase family 4 protein [Erythrobacter sp.]